METVDVIDIDSSEDGSMLYILDASKGFTYVRIDTIESPVLKWLYDFSRLYLSFWFRFNMALLSTIRVKLSS